jgi:GT2 family glycosyltransferase
MYGEDLDWCYRFRRLGWQIFYVPTSTVIHLKGRSGSTVSERMIPEFFRAMEVFCRKHYFPGASRVRVAFTLAGIRLWLCATLFQNWLRKEKRVTP